LVILQINVEGWTAAKRELIQKMTREMKVTVVLVQETHQTMTDQLKLYGFTLAGHIPSEHHGIATFVRSSILFSLVGYSNAGEPNQWITITINGICISNVYHPPPAFLNVSLLPSASDQCIISGDFNCRHENWGYQDSNQNGNRLADWSCTNNLHTLYDPKQPASSQSARWNSGTNQDVTFSTHIRGTIPTREVLEQFPHSQHCPSLIRTMPLISFTRSAPIPRWNFRKPDWERYKDLTNNLADSLPTPRMDKITFAYKQFTQTLETVAKQTIPRSFRKSYTPT